MAEDARKAQRWAKLLGLAARPRPLVGATPADVVHRDNKLRLLRYRPRPEGLAGGAPVLLVPSLINRHYVLDLMPGKSFVEFLVAQGHDVYCIDWGTPGDEDRYVTFDDIVDGMLGRALRVTTRLSGAKAAHVLGYCMGGTMAAIHAAAHPERIASLTAVAAPIRFHDEGLLSAWSNTRSLDLRALVDGCGNVPWQLMQSSFLLLRPTLSASKVVHLIDKAWDDEYVDGFFALDAWGNDNVSFPGEAYVRYIQELYREERLTAGTFALSGLPVHLARLVAPTLAVTFQHDDIVPFESARVLLDHIGAPRKEWVHLQGGHVGAMVSRAAARGLWPQISAWFRSVDAPPVAAVEPQRASRPPRRRARA